MDIQKFFKRKPEVDDVREKRKEAIRILAKTAQDVIDRMDAKDKRFHDIPTSIERRQTQMS